MKKLAIIITRGGYNNILQACEWAQISVAHGVSVSVFFRDEAASNMSLTKIKELIFTQGYKGRETRVREFLKKANKGDMQALLRTAKETGDIKFSICRDSMNYFDMKVEDLIPELDEVQQAEAFWKEEILSAEQVLTF